MVEQLKKDVIYLYIFKKWTVLLYASTCKVLQIYDTGFKLHFMTIN